MGTKRRAWPGEHCLPMTSPLLPCPHFPMLVPSPPTVILPLILPVSVPQQGLHIPPSPLASHNQFSLSYETFSE